MPSPSDYRLIPLTHGQFAKVSAEDFEWLSQWKWQALWSPHTKTFYARRTAKCGDRRIAVHMHREILGKSLSSAQHVDHVNRDTLDNRRSNLRIATRSENMRNRKTPAHNTSGYKGVSFRKSRGTWMAIITIDGKNRCVGSRKTPQEAYDLYCAAIAEQYGGFGRRS